MEPRARYIIVGIVTLLLFIGAVMSFVWFRSGRSAESDDHYIVLFKGVSLSGVQTDGLVTMRGIQVGRVRGLKISPSDIEQVEVEITVKPDTPVKTDTTAVVNTNLLTGLSVIDLTGGSQAAPKLATSRRGYPYPVIIQGQSDIQALTKSLPELMSGIAQLTQEGKPLLENINSILNDENKALLKDILKNTNTLTASLAKSSHQVQDVVNDIASVSGSLKELSHSLSAQSNQIGETVNSSMRDVTQKLSETSERMKAVLSEMSPPERVLFGPDSKQRGPGE